MYIIVHQCALLIVVCLAWCAHQSKFLSIFVVMTMKLTPLLLLLIPNTFLAKKMSGDVRNPDFSFRPRQSFLNQNAHLFQRCHSQSWCWPPHGAGQQWQDWTPIRNMPSKFSCSMGRQRNFSQRDDLPVRNTARWTGEIRKVGWGERKKSRTEGDKGN